MRRSYTAVFWRLNNQNEKVEDTRRFLAVGDEEARKRFDRIDQDEFKTEKGIIQEGCLLRGLQIPRNLPLGLQSVEVHGCQHYI